MILIITLHLYKEIYLNYLKNNLLTIHIAFIYGCIAKQEDTATSDIDLMLICDNLTYADLFKLLEEVQVKLGRPIHPTFYSPAEWIRNHQANNNFLAQLIKQPKIFLIGTEDELAKLG